VLYDETDMSADDIQFISYYQSYLYSRCNRSISAPPPAMYAHLCAKRARSHMAFLGSKCGQLTAQVGELSERQTQDLKHKLQVKASLEGTLYYI